MPAEMMRVEGAGVRALLAARLVSRGEYRAFLDATGRPIPPPLTRGESPSRPVTWVSQTDAAGYCHWLAAREGVAYRLPAVAELIELYADVARDGISPDLWSPNAAGRPPDCVIHDACFCEWTQETEALPQFGSPAEPPRLLGGIFYPPWLREGANSTHVQAHMLASEGYSFISFRVARDA